MPLKGPVNENFASKIFDYPNSLLPQHDVMSMYYGICTGIEMGKLPKQENGKNKLLKFTFPFGQWVSLTFDKSRKLKFIVVKKLRSQEVKPYDILLTIIN